jgi:DNA-binding transcriptional regulator LsrR (DeoR family)
MDNINLDHVALEIARQRLLHNTSYKDLARLYFTSPSTIHRRLTNWLKENRFDLQDKLAVKKTAAVAGKDDKLAAELVQRTGIWRARVAQISGVDAAYTEQYLEEPESEMAQSAFKAGDDLHRCLGEVAAELILNSLRKNMTLGVSSGRGVGFTVEALAEVIRQTPSWVRGYESISLVSLCGGVHAGKWGQSSVVTRDFDADENVFALAAALKIPRKNITYISGPVPIHSGTESENRIKSNLDIAIIGLGQLNTRHHYFRDIIETKLKTAADPMQTIMEWQDKNPALCDSLAEIVMKLYPARRDNLPADFVTALQEVNNTILTVSPSRIKNAGEVVLIAGGRQKAEALSGLLKGEYPGAPIDRKNLTLITDSWSAETILKKMR